MIAAAAAQSRRSGAYDSGTDYLLSGWLRVAIAVNFLTDVTNVVAFGIVGRYTLLSISPAPSSSWRLGNHAASSPLIAALFLGARPADRRPVRRIRLGRANRTSRGRTGKESVMSTVHRNPGEPGVVAVHGHDGWHRGMLTACIIMAAFGTAWALWGAAGLPAAAQGAVVAAGIVAGVITIGRAVRLRRTAPEPAASMFRSRQYRLVVAAEAGAIAAGLAGLTVAGASEYIAAWVAIVVGMHFLAFGRFISAFYYPVGAIVTVGGIAGIAVGVAGASAGAIEATAGLTAAACLLSASAARVFRVPGRAAASTAADPELVDARRTHDQSPRRTP